ncbi:facilitated trehalose transporter Tret1-like [Schistocerca gregaria]|uniref:facilitated trehalose transporter Tret1-like n=1 Tax=Schistocerca gregaria TaxID=7010 RepID=UPI00211F1627|nr:facilitated trehalose transporter Tret1-like [Schistocerca gregaria]
MLPSRVPLQLPAAMAVSLAYLNAGMFFGWSSPIIPELQKNTSHIPITEDEGSWLASVGLLASVPPTLLLGVFVETVGRRWALLFAALPLLTVAVWQRFATTFGELLATIVVGSVSTSIILPLGPVYLVEIAEDRIRGFLVSMATTMAGLGSLLMTAVGPKLSFFTVTEIMMVWPVLFAAVFWWMPESPYFLLAKHRKDEATKALMRLRGKSSEEEVQAELEVIQRGLEENTQKEVSAADAFRELRRNATSRRLFMLSMVFTMCVVLSGVDAINANTLHILVESNSSLDAELSAIGVSSSTVLSCIVFSLVVDRLGRKPLLLFSLCGCCVATTSLGVYFFLSIYASEGTTDAVFWLPLTGLIVYFVSFGMGLNSLLWVMPNELVPPSLRVLASSSVYVLVAVLGFSDTKLFQVVTDAYGAFIPFWFFATCSFLGVIFVWFCIPETKGRSLADISSEKSVEPSPQHDQSSQPT